MNSRLRLRILVYLGVGVVSLFSAIATSQPEEETMVRLDVANEPTLGPFLIDGSGFALYSSDEPCEGDCEGVWEPITVADAIGFGPEVSLGLIGTVSLADTSLQVTYNELPLYRFADDLEPGQHSGQGLDNTWYLVSPDGELKPTVAESVMDSASVDPSVMEAGATTFANVCSSCHGASGGGGLGPRLVGNERLADLPRIARMVINGSGYMPAVGRQMSDEQLAAVFTFIRNSWGNEFGPVEPEEVRAAR